MVCLHIYIYIVYIYINYIYIYIYIYIYVPSAMVIFDEDIERCNSGRTPLSRCVA